MPGPIRDERAGVLLRHYRDAFGGPELPVPVESIAEDFLGLSVDEGELEVSGMLLPAARQIWLNATERTPRRRFTLAHELGHWVCQHLEGKTAPIYCRAADVQPEPTARDRTLEREANVFAAELLMPERAVRDAWSGDADECATHFGVSGEAMRWRLYSFGLGSAPT